MNSFVSVAIEHTHEYLLSAEYQYVYFSRVDEGK